MATHEQQWSSATPGLLVILLDQSSSMQEIYDGSDSKAVFAAKAVNRVIDEIIQKNFDGDKPKNRCFISIIGYGSTAKEIRSDFLVEMDAKPIRIDKIKKKVSDGAGGLVEQDFNLPIWVEAEANGLTDMEQALEITFQIVTKWINDKPNNPAPVIINISDGMPTSDLTKTINNAKKVMALNSIDGNVIIFSAHIEKTGNEIIFPNSPNQLPSDHAKFLFEISSEIPASYIPAATKNGLAVNQGSRGCIFQSNAETLIKLIDFGSSKGQGDRMN